MAETVDSLQAEECSGQPAGVACSGLVGLAGEFGVLSTWESDYMCGGVGIPIFCFCSGKMF